MVTFPVGSDGGRQAGPRILAYCHDGVGLGHLRRTLNICERVAADRPEATFLIATGNPYISLFSPLARVDYLKLPSLRKLDNDVYEAKFLAMDPERVLHYRESLLLETARHFEPHVVLVDKAPVGVCGELVPTLCWLRRNRPDVRIVFGMRDIEDDPESTIRQWAKLNVSSMLEQYYDEVWVYGMRSLFDVATEYKLSSDVRSKVRFVGYVANQPCEHESANGAGQTSPGASGRRPKVLVTVGGGTDGGELLRTYLADAARRVAAMGGASVIVAGPDLPTEQSEALKAAAATVPHIDWIRFAPCMSCRIREADAVVCMGGYNTLCEVVRNGKPVLVVPRTHPRLEQTMRARLWSQRGVVDVLERESMTPASLAERLSALIQRRRSTDPTGLDFGGVERVCDRIGAMLNGGVTHASAVSM